jgi:hypothetical protein
MGGILGIAIGSRIAAALVVYVQKRSQSVRPRIAATVKDVSTETLAVVVPQNCKVSLLEIVKQLRKVKDDRGTGICQEQ